MFYTWYKKLIIFKNILCIKSLSQEYYYKRIIFINRDRKKNTLISKKIIATLQLVANTRYLFAQNFDLLLLNSQKIFLIKNLIIKVKLRDLN